MFIYEYSIYLGFPSLMSQTFYIRISMHIEEKPRTSRYVHEETLTEHARNLSRHTVCLKSSKIYWYSYTRSMDL